MQEIWKPVQKYKNYYEVSNFGRIRSIDRYIKNSIGVTKFKKGRIIKLSDSAGYEGANICVDSKIYKFKIHNLVAEAFLQRIEGKNWINHKDFNRKNNCVENLEWCTPKENVSHTILNGRWKPSCHKNTKSMLGKFGAEHNRSKAVIQYDLQKNEIARFGGTREAGRSVNLQPESIARCCRGERNCYKNYIWKYE
jgi:hypothetical protein